MQTKNEHWHQGVIKVKDEGSYLTDAPSAFLTSKRFMLLPKFEICIAPAAGIEPGPLGPKAQVITTTPASQLITGVKNSV